MRIRPKKLGRMEKGMATEARFPDTFCLLPMSENPEATTMQTSTRTFSERHRQILLAAVELIAERGYAGASLRTLAKKVGLRQPSLYHYFESKAAMVEQIIELFAEENSVAEIRLPDDLLELPMVLVESIERTWAQPSHAAFLRAAFSLSRVDARFAARFRQLLDQRSEETRRKIAQKYTQSHSSFPEQDLVNLIRLVSDAVSYRRMELEVLYDRQPVDEGYQAFTDGVVAMARQMIVDRLRRTAANGRSATTGEIAAHVTPPSVLASR